MARLTVFREGQAVMEHPLAKQQVTLGRDAKNDITLEDLALSRFHARLDQRGDQHVVVDLGSQNGVYVNGMRIQGEKALRPGDRVGIGRYVGVFDTQAAPAPAAPKDDAPELLLLCNGVEMERVRLTSQECVIGRSHTCDVVIGLLGLSRRHALVKHTQSGWVLTDLGSQNGTFVNEEKIEGAYILEDGDVINFFEYSVVFQAPEALTTTARDLSALPVQKELERVASTVVEPHREVSRSAPLPLVPPRPNTTRPLRPSLAAAAAAAERAGEDDDVGDEDSESQDDDAADAFESGTTEMERGVPPGASRTRAAPVVDVPLPGSAGASALWPSERETEEALTRSGQLAPAGLLEVRVDNRLLTEVPLDRSALRIGADARCDVALPPLTSISGWHLVVVKMGSAVLVSRVGDAALPRVGGRAVAQAFLREGDRVDLGRVTLVLRQRS